MEMRQRPLVGLTGYKFSGKDTAAAGLKGEKLAFGVPLKMMLNSLGLSQAQLFGDQKETPISWIPGNPTARRMMETLGTKWGREMIHQDLWVGVVDKQICDLLAEGQMQVVVTDIRFEEEAAMVRKRGGIIIHIKRGEPEGWWARIKRRFGPASERGIKKGPSDYVVWNNSTIDELQQAVRLLASHY